MLKDDFEQIIASLYSGEDKAETAEKIRALSRKAEKIEKQANKGRKMILSELMKTNNDFFVKQGESPQRVRAHLWRLATLYNAKIQITSGVFFSYKQNQPVKIFRVEVLDRGEKTAEKGKKEHNKNYDAEKREKIKRMLEQGLNMSQIARLLKLSRQRIHQIKNELESK